MTLTERQWDFNHIGGLGHWVYQSETFVIAIDCVCPQPPRPSKPRGQKVGISQRSVLIISPYLGVSIAMVVPQMVGLFQGKSPSRHGWWLGVPPFQETTTCERESSIFKSHIHIDLHQTQGGKEKLVISCGKEYTKIVPTVMGGIAVPQSWSSIDTQDMAKKNRKQKCTNTISIHKLWMSIDISHQDWHKNT